MDILTIIGARPQFVKAAVVSRALREIGIEEVILHTGQHFDYEMDGVFFEELGIPTPAFNLNAGGGAQGQQTGKMLEGIESFLLKLAQRPKFILVYGDTNSTLAAALVGVKMHIPIVHVEAGLRSYNRRMPEEINRVLTDQISEILFCTSEEGVQNLKKEGIQKGVFSVGDVMCDAYHYFTAISNNKYKDFSRSIISGPFALMTVHRPANTENPENLYGIFNAISKLNTNVVWPVHPRMKSSLASLNLPNNLKVTSPFSYLQMLQMLKDCDFVITDSGGLQKEAYWAEKKCITLREETEWVETVECGWNFLTGANTLSILEASVKDLPRMHPDLYGDGQASKKISEVLKAKV